MYLLWLDTETGGIGLDKSLLELGVLITDDELKPVGSSGIWYIKPDDGIYKCTAEALSINKINLVEHDKRAKPYKQVGKELYEYLHNCSVCLKEKLIPVGKNVDTDIQQVCDKLISRGSWENFCSYQKMDISSVVRFLQLQKKIPHLNKTSLSSLCDHFNIPTEGLHSSIGDNLLGLEILKRLVQL